MGCAAIQALLDLRSALTVVPALRSALSSASSPLLASIRDVVCSVPALQTLATRIEQLLDDEVCSGKAAFIAVTQQIFAIRIGSDGFLDVGACFRRGCCLIVGSRFACESTQELLHHHRGHPRARRCAVSDHWDGHQGHLPAFERLLVPDSGAGV